MGKIKNMGTGTMRFKEGIICSGSAANNEALIVTGSAVILGNLSDYVAVIDNDQGSSGHGLKVTSDGTGSGTNLFDVESASTTVFRVRGDGRVGIGKVTSLPAAKLTVSSSNANSDLAIAHKIHHIGDSDTHVQFDNDIITLTAGASSGDVVMSGSVHAPNGITGSITKAASDLDGNRLAGGIYQLDDGLIQNPHSSYSRIFFPADDTLVETVGAVSTNYKIAPFNGELIKMQVKSIQDFTSKALTASLHIGTGTNNAYSATPSVSVALNGQAAHTVYTFDFLGRSGNTFNEGNIFGFSLELSENWAGNETIHFTSVVRFNPYN